MPISNSPHLPFNGVEVEEYGIFQFLCYILAFLTKLPFSFRKFVKQILTGLHLENMSSCSIVYMLGSSTSYCHKKFASFNKPC